MTCVPRSTITRRYKREASLTCVGPGVALQVEGVIETFPAVRTEKPLDFSVTFQMFLQMFGRVECD